MAIVPILLIKSSETSGLGILIIGITLLLFTFIISCAHLYGKIDVSPSPSLLASFGEALSPLIQGAIRFLYLGLMVWMASVVTKKGLILVLESKINKGFDSKN